MKLRNAKYKLSHSSHSICTKLICKIILSEIYADFNALPFSDYHNAENTLNALC